jgi:hypothetical protein
MFEFLNGYAEYIDIFVNIVTVCIIIYYIYYFIKEMQSDNEFNSSNLTSYSDLDEFNKQYQDTELCKLFTSLTDRDKEYLYHVINANRLKYKNEKPKVTKQINSVKSQLFYNMIITLIIKQKLGAAVDSIKYNTLLNFINTKI